MLRGLITLGLAVASLSLAAPAFAGGWLPHAKGATWVYQWKDSVYNPTPTKEKVTVKTTKGGAFTLAWTTDGQGNATTAPTSNGTVSFAETPNGLANTNWTSNAPPAGFPILCSSMSQCGNSLASTYYNVIWGSRAPLLEEPLLRGANWASTGGTQNDVGSSNRYVGTELVSVPAFSRPVEAAKVQSTITQAGALGDPYGSGVRTVWWVYGVGPVKITFAHAGGSKAPVTTAVLLETNQKPQAPPPDVNYFPLAKGQTLTLPLDERALPEVPGGGEVRRRRRLERLRAVHGGQRLGPDQGGRRVRVHLDHRRAREHLGDGQGRVDREAAEARAGLAPGQETPALLHAVRPDELRLRADPAGVSDRGTSWAGGATGLAYAVFGVTGTTKVLGLQTVTVPAGTFRALAVRSTLLQKGFPFGSGTRTAWFAPGRGLVKLVFQHGDGSVSDVELLK